MGLHVDIVKTDPLGVAEQFLARVGLEHGAVVIDSPDDAYWHDLLLRVTGVDPDDDPEGFLDAVPERLDGTYVFATRPHDDADCEYFSEPAALTA